MHQPKMQQHRKVNMMNRISLLALVLASSVLNLAAAPRSPLPYKGVSALPDIVHLSELSQVRIQGWLGDRVSTADDDSWQV